MPEPHFSYREVPLSECATLGHRLQDQGRSWHIHVLAPDCRMNPKPGRFAFVIEDRTDEETYVAFSPERPRAVNLELLKVLHGEHVLDRPAGQDDDAAAAESPLVSRIRDLDRRGVAWHHHMHFPDCMLNPHPGKWAISLEAADSDTVESEAFAEEPHEVLSAIEIIYFSK